MEINGKIREKPNVDSLKNIDTPMITLKKKTETNLTK